MNFPAILFMTSPVTLPVLTLLILGLRKRHSNKKQSIVLITIGVVYLIIGGGTCMTLLNFVNHMHQNMLKLKFETIQKFQDGTKSYEFGHRGKNYEINVIEGNDTSYIGNLHDVDSVTFSFLNKQFLQILNNEDAPLFVDRNNPRNTTYFQFPLIYSDTINSIIITSYKYEPNMQDTLVRNNELASPTMLNRLEFYNLLNDKSSFLEVNETSLPHFPEGYTLEIRNNELIINKGKKTWKYNIQSQMDHIMN